MVKGRSSELIKKRNAALLRRCYYWSEVQRLRFDDVLTILSEKEFFISPSRIMAIINEAEYNSEDGAIEPPRIKTPKLSYKQLELFSDDAGMAISQIRKQK